MKRPTPLKTIGILGGMSNQATAEYYRLLNDEINYALGGWEIAETLIQGVNFGNIEYFIRHNEWQAAKAYLQNKAIGAEKGGADLLLCVSNTMHRVLDDIEEIINIPFLHIADPTAAAIKAAGLSKIGLLGTKPVMEASYISDRYEQHGIKILTPNEGQQQRIHQIIFDELVKGEIKTTSREEYVDICQDLVSQGAEGIILGCTEIFLLLRQENIPQTPLFNTTELHVKAAAKFAMKDLNTAS